MTRNQHAAYTHCAAAEQKQQHRQDDAQRAFSALARAARILFGVGRACLHAAGHIFLVGQRALIAGIRRIAVIINRRVGVVVVIGERMLVGRVAKVTIIILRRGICFVRMGIGSLLLLLTAANGGAVPAVSGGKLVGFRNGANDLRFLNGTANPVGLLLHLADAFFAILAAFFQVFQLVGQVGAVEFFRVKTCVVRLRLLLGCGKLFFFVKRRHFQRRLFLVQGFFPRGGAVLFLRERRAALGAFGQVSCVPCAAFGTFHRFKTSENGSIKDQKRV